MEILFLLISLFFGFRNPLYFLIFPIALISGPGFFIDTRTVIFDELLYGRNILKDVMVIYMLLISVFLTLRDRKIMFITGKLAPLFIYYLIICFLSIGKTDWLAVSRIFLYLPIGYYLILYIFRFSDFKQFLQFFNTLIWITGICSVLFILNSSGLLKLYDISSLYKEINFSNAEFYRDFKTRPYFANIIFIIALCIKIFRKKYFNRHAINLVLITFPFVILLTFTRSVALITIVQLILLFLYLLYKKRYVLNSYRFISKLPVIIFALILAISLFSPQIEYFSSRFEEFNDTSGIENVNKRKLYVDTALKLVNQKQELLFGTGFVRGKSHTEMAEVGAFGADNTISFLLLYTGFLGVILYFYSLIIHVKYQFIKLKKVFNPISLALFIYGFTYIFFKLIMGGTSWGDPFAFFPFALIIILNSQFKKEIVL